MQNHSVTGLPSPLVTSPVIRALTTVERRNRSRRNGRGVNTHTHNDWPFYSSPLETTVQADICAVTSAPVADTARLSTAVLESFTEYLRSNLDVRKRNDNLCLSPSGPILRLGSFQEAFLTYPLEEVPEVSQTRPYQFGSAPQLPASANTTAFNNA